MRKIVKLVSLTFLLLAVASCGMLTGDKFVYLGHGEDTPDYQLYYDKTRKLFLFVDKRNGCFQKDDTGTCMAFTLKEAREFREKVLSKMIDIDLRLTKDAYGDYAIKELSKAGITTVNKPIKIDNVFATPIRQIVLDRKQQYHLVREKFKIDANLVAMVTNGDNGKKRIKVAYTVDFPRIVKKYNAKLRPFVVDPEYMYTHMTIDSVHEARFMQKDVMKNQKDVTKELDNYLKKVVDEEEKPNGHPKEVLSRKVAKLESDIVTNNIMMEPSGSTTVDNDSAASGSTVKAKDLPLDHTMTEDEASTDTPDTK
ncbi:FTN_0109 family protein [Francisella adeliensis]|uniref:Lipoprotein n=1 Tax=Francisella adeliensis TaxID=2007306 RepID=A0A2Z4XXQ0_9GAMM|nr:hypothetical protein [Francisella adeliensis]AXA33193.1 hypothetical protein CDH04_01595 [Francisella adeliensis]MBK2085088.1 hypothetical protein [Francisella adeliensis]MBK2096921.1 hypothetical protein [Francisella adeliensis]QIW11421.1 hypothetical protein FZC43_01600 [Francisella adeliensis]QIW13296.1 hypothetical protein FZC44_01600 [Francisella adeliensis]